MFKSKTTDEEFYALKHVSFNVFPGESIGIIGKNGAGKSTLLKILSKITPPTSGKIISRGRIASLLEVGTGFHAELSGRENIFLNGSILGMKRREIQNKFDEIVDFSGVEKFLDTPLKHFSSGMQLRLAFAVAAFLENEILIIDEVLAVGDAEFQKKCMGKMDEVSNSGRTILFVSHNMGAIAQLCKKGVLLAEGKTSIISDMHQVIDKYLDSNIKSSRDLNRKHLTKWKNKNQFVELQMINSEGHYVNEFKHNEKYFVQVKLYLPEYNPSLELAISLYDRSKNRIFTIHEPLSKFKMSNEEIIVKIMFPSNFLTPGNYSWLMCINHPGIIIQDIQDDICEFIIVDNGSQFYNYQAGSYGSVFVNYEIESIY
jgi:lipopolysaccharide transport system ATP-binding protein